MAEGAGNAMEEYQATDFISVFQKVKLALNLLVGLSLEWYAYF